VSDQPIQALADAFDELWKADFLTRLGLSIRELRGDLTRFEKHRRKTAPVHFLRDR